MGFSWAVYLAQQAKTAAVVKATGMAESELLQDLRLDLSLKCGPQAFVYMDNMGLIGKDREEVNLPQALRPGPSDARIVPWNQMLRHPGG